MTAVCLKWMILNWIVIWLKPALWANTSLPEVAWIPRRLRGPGSNPNTASSFKGDHLKLKTWIYKFVKSKIGRISSPAGFLNFSTGNLTVDPNNVKFWNMKKHLIDKRTNLFSYKCKPVYEDSLGRGERLWGKRDLPPAIGKVSNSSVMYSVFCILHSVFIWNVLHDYDGFTGISFWQVFTSFPQERQSTSWWSAARTKKLPVEKIKLFSISNSAAKPVVSPATRIEAK